MERIAIVDGIRTPFCKMGTVFNDITAQELGAIALRELLERSAIDLNEIDEVIIGNVGQPAEAANIARVVSLLAGIPQNVPALTVHRNCASGIEAAVQAAMKIRLGDGDCFIAGGTESMTNIAFHLQKPLQDQLTALSRAKTLKDRLAILIKFYPKYFDFKKSLKIALRLGLTDPVYGLNMGQTAEVLAKEFGITRKEQDEFSLISHQRAFAAREILKEEIAPVIPGSRYKKAIEDDNGPRENQTMEALTKLKPVFDRKSGTVTAGNSSQITDGACMLLVMSEKKAKDLGMEPLGYMTHYAFSGVEPNRMGIGPAHAIPEVLKKANKRLDEMQVVEINEAFAAQVIACTKSLESDEFTKKYGYEGYTGRIDPAILNPNGGGVALGHPVGTTGARLILTVLHHLKRNNLNTGLASLCVGGGQGAAVILER